MKNLLESSGALKNEVLQIIDTFTPLSKEFVLEVGHHESLLNDIESTGFLEPALLHCGGVIKAVDDIIENRCKNAFVTMTVGGHHAGPTGHWGFCYLNDIACAVYRLRKNHGIKKILYIDQDFHHGDGTMKFFRYDPDFCYIDTHVQQSGEQPGVIFDKEKTYIDIILPRGLGGDGFSTIIKEAIDVVLNHWKFLPEFLINYAGFDAHVSDGFNRGSVKVDHHAFIEMANVYVKIAELVCNNRLLCIMGGGYKGKEEDAAAICAFNNIMVLANKWDLLIKKDENIQSSDGIAKIKINTILKDLVKASR